jgi:hypothetical protein
MNTETASFPQQLLARKIGDLTDGELAFVIEAGGQPQFKFTDGERTRLELCKRTLDCRHEIAEKLKAAKKPNLSPSERESLELAADGLSRRLAASLEQRGEA